jgi:hypothetical protein
MPGDIADWINQDFDPNLVDEEREVRCKLCNQRGLYWEERGRGRFVLVDEEGKAHAPHCEGRSAKPAEFPLLEDPT